MACRPDHKERFGGGHAADKLVSKGYTIYGWDVEWRKNKDGSIETPEEMLKKIQNALSSNKTKKKDKIIMLMHDKMFRASMGNKEKLKDLIKLLRKAGFIFDFVSNY